MINMISSKKKKLHRKVKKKNYILLKFFIWIIIKNYW
jgi:hypothetical protein